MTDKINVKVIIFDTRNILPSGLNCPGSELYYLNDFNQVTETVEQNTAENVVVLNGSSFEDGIHEKFKELKDRFSNVHLSVILFKNQSSSDIKKTSALNLYEIFCGENFTNDSLSSLVDTFKTPLDSALKRKCITISDQDKTSSQIIDFDLSNNTSEEAFDKTSEDRPEIAEDQVNEETKAKEKTAFTALENVIKKAIGFNKNNKEEREYQEQKNQEMEDLFSPQEMEHEMADENNKDLEDKTEEVELDKKLQKGDNEDVQPEELSETINLGGEDAELDIGGEGADLDLGGEGADLGLGGEGADLDLGAEGADLDLGGEGADLELGDEGADLDLGGEGADLDLGGEGADLDLGGEGADLDLGAEGADLDLGAEGADLDLGAEGADLDLGAEGADLDLGGEGANLDLGAEGANLDLGAEGANLDLGAEGADLDLGAEGADLDFTMTEASSSEPESEIVDETPESTDFIGDSDETGDIDLNILDDQNGSPSDDAQLKNLNDDAQLKGSDDEAQVVEEFDYKTSMIGQQELDHVNAVDTGIDEKVEDLGVVDDADLFSESEGVAHSKNSSTKSDFEGDDLIHAKAVIETLKSQRDSLEDENAELKKHLMRLENENSKYKEELTESKIETSIFKQKYEKLNVEREGGEENLKDNLRIAEAKIKSLKVQIETLKTNNIIDRQSVSKRERDLESKIELMEVDISSQLKSREEKILELKRKIETLEFNMETTALQNQGLRENKKMLSERLRLVSESLRGAGRVLDESIDFEDMFEDDSHEEQAS